MNKATRILIGGGAAMAAMGAASAQEAVTAPGPDGALAGTYVAPAEGKPVVLILPGSGPTDRDGNNPLGVTAAPYRLLAEALAERGVGTLRADKRGLFASKDALRDPAASRIAGYVEDVAAWRGLVRTKTGADCVWLLGHSEGGVIALAAAQSLDGLCGLVLVAAPGRPIGTILREQLAANPANAPILPQALAAIAALEKGEVVDAAGLHPALAPLFGPQVQGFLGDLMRHDPAALAAKTRLPVLIVQGGRDLQIPREDGERLHAARPDARLVTFTAMNHVLKDVASDDRMANMASYADPALPLTPGLADTIAGFVTEGRK